MNLLEKEVESIKNSTSGTNNNLGQNEVMKMPSLYQFICFIAGLFVFIAVLITIRRIYFIKSIKSHEINHEKV